MDHLSLHTAPYFPYAHLPCVHFCMLYLLYESVVLLIDQNANLTLKLNVHPSFLNEFLWSLLTVGFCVNELRQWFIVWRVTNSLLVSVFNIKLIHISMVCKSFDLSQISLVYYYVQRCILWGLFCKSKNVHFGTLGLGQYFSSLVTAMFTWIERWTWAVSDWNHQF